jgi:hypothetical protein
VTIFYLQR